MAACMHSEVLCYIQNHIGSAAKDNIVSAVTSFYSEVEIDAAKCVLHNFVDGLASKPEGLPRHVKRQASDNKKRLDCEDTIKLFRALDVAKVSLPTFMASDLSRVPTVKPGEVDVYFIAVTMANLTNQVQKLSARLAALENTKCTSEAGARPSIAGTSHTGSADRENVDTDVSAAAVAAAAAGASTSWAGIAGNKPEEWKKVEPVKKRIPAPVRVKGTKSAEVTNDKLKTVPRRSVLSAYVGRLHLDTTEEQLTTYLSGEGIKGIVCRKLKAKNGAVFKTAAFFVSCCAESQDLFYDNGCWPDGVELRDWVFYNRD